MIKINEKIHFPKKMQIMDVEMNTDHKKIIADVLEHFFYDDIKYNKKLNLNKLIYISDNAQTNYILKIDKKYFDKFLDFENIISFPILVNVVPAYKLPHMKEEDLQDVFFDNNFFIVGFINNIHEEIYRIITTRTYSSLVVVFGDPLVESPEFGNYFLKILTNNSFSHKIEADQFRLSDKKKINIGLCKLRKNQADINQISSSSNMIVEYQPVINIDEIEDFLMNPDSYVVAPNEFSYVINSEMFKNKYGDRLELNQGNIFYTRYPYVLEDCGKIDIIPPLSQVELIVLNRIVESKYGLKFYDFDVLFRFKDENNNDVSLIGKNVLINYYAFMQLFELDRFSNYEEINDISEYLERVENSFETKEAAYDSINEYHTTELQLYPFKLISSDDIKYCINCKNLLAYIERNERSVNYTYDSNYFKLLCKATDMINIKYADEFIRDILE